MEDKVKEDDKGESSRGYKQIEGKIKQKGKHKGG